MHMSLRFLAISGLVLLTAGCGSKGSGSPDEMDTDSGSSSTTMGTASGTGGDTTSTSSTETSGTGGSAGGPIEAELQYGFDSGLEGWDYNYSSSASGVPLIDAAGVEVEWNEEDGNPGGAFMCTIPYEEAGQYVGFGIDLTQTPIDLSGHTMSADVMLVSGVGDDEDLLTNPAGAKLYAKSTQDLWIYAAGEFNNITERGVWVTIEFDMDYPDYVDETNGIFDPSEVLEIGVQFDTSGTSTTAQEGTWLIDNVSY